VIKVLVVRPEEPEAPTLSVGRTPVPGRAKEGAAAAPSRARSERTKAMGLL
jgi:hypothetical protein